MELTKDVIKTLEIRHKISLLDYALLKMEFRDLARIFQVNIFEIPNHPTYAAFIASEYSQEWQLIYVEKYYFQSLDPQAFYENMVSLYLKTCREGIFPCEADQEFGYMLHTSKPDEKVSLELGHFP